MEASLVTMGVAFVAAAIVGGGLEAGGVKVPAVDSPARQLLLALLGFGMIAGAWVSKRRARAAAASVAVGAPPAQPVPVGAPYAGGAGGGGAVVVPPPVAVRPAIDWGKAAAVIAVVVPLLAGGAVAGARIVGRFVSTMFEPATLTLTPSSGRLGTVITATGKGFGSDEDVRIRVHNDRVAEVRTTGDGTFTVQFRMPSDAVCFSGECSVIAQGQRTLKFDDGEFSLEG